MVDNCEKGNRWEAQAMENKCVNNI